MNVSSRWWLAGLLAVLLAGVLGAQEPPAPETPTPPGDDTAEDPAARLSERFAQWLREVEPIITGPEKELFLSLAQDYQRDAFIQEFWKVRDPYPRTARNELKERWPEHLALARSRFGSLDDDRARVLLIHGEADGGFEVRCTTTRIPVEIWGYRESPTVNFPFVVVFVRQQGTGPARVWRPSLSGVATDAVVAGARACINGSRMVQVLTQLRSDADNYERTLRKVLAKPRPRSEEWIYAFIAHTTDVNPGTEELPVRLDVAFLGRHQNRTVVQGLFEVPTENVASTEYAGYRSYDFLLTGDVIFEDKLFETFRYKFGLPAPEVSATIPLAFQRFLRPGKYRWVLKIEDLGSKRATHIEREVDVPTVESFVETPVWKDPETAKLFAEATAAIASGETGIRIIPPQGDVLTGFVRFDTLVSGNEIEKVLFYLDDKQILTRNRPPWNVEIDLGPFPDLRTLRVEGIGAQGQEVASDQLLINSGDYRFAVRLLEPRRGATYTKSLRARVEVQVPQDRTLDHVELYLNETKVATLYQEPFVQPILLPEKAEVAYVRAVAVLPDGNSTEDVVFINSPDYVEQIEVQFVELYTTVLDGAGRPVEGLVEKDFQVFEDEVKQKIARFERIDNLPIHVGILIDNSASMFAAIEEVKKAALSFFQQAITPKDRAAVITFNTFPNLAVRLTNDRQALGRGLAGLVAEGQTALYDSVMFGLYHLAGIKGQRAILVLSDGKDEASRFSFEATLDYARRAGITIYTIGLGLSELGARQKLDKLAEETGGASFFISDVGALETIYRQIQRELRSQYLIAYQSSNASEDKKFRSVELKTERKDIVVKTISGYYP